MTRQDQEWLASLFEAIDAKNPGAFSAHLAADAEFQFGNLPPVEGREQIAKFVGDFFNSIQGLQHSLTESWRCGEHLICRGTVAYRRHDGKGIRVPFANIMTLEQGLAKEYRIYADISPLWT